MTNQLLPEIRCCQLYLGVATLISNFTEYGSDTLALQLFIKFIIYIYIIYKKYDAQNKSEKSKDLDVGIKTIVSKITNNSGFCWHIFYRLNVISTSNYYIYSFGNNCFPTTTMQYGTFHTVFP
jgi:hypothetical protein